MTARFKVIGKAAPKPKPKHLLGVYEIPDDAIWMAQDIGTLETMSAMLDRLQARSFVEPGDRSYPERVNDARKSLRRLAFLINLLRQIAERNLADNFTGRKITRLHKQSIADVWQLLLDGFKHD